MHSFFKLNNKNIQTKTKIKTKSKTKNRHVINCILKVQFKVEIPSATHKPQAVSGSYITFHHSL